MARMPELRSEDSGSEAGRSSRSPRHKSSPRNRRLEMEAWAWPEGLEHWVLLAALAAAVCAAVPTEYHAPLLLPCLVVAVARGARARAARKKSGRPGWRGAHLQLAVGRHA